ncbi:MAG: D-glycero-beta-D-manno-heptose 1-phosphate adenylyltransferase [Candidatus Cloacimonetes bacterium]|nr:D-glycero-beta-D-manno-heptose 1-phosphate adenylyltransferase [Candidatus Cloacimonadota bacterium]
MNKLLSKQELIKELGELEPEIKIVFTNGCFDLLHLGHIRYLKEAADLGDILVVGLNSDYSVKRLKGNSRPLQPQEHRAEILSALEFVDYIVIFDEDTPLNLIRSIQPDVLVKGGDWKPEQIVGSELVLHKGGIVRSLPYYQGFSTSGMIKKIREMVIDE